MGLSNKNHVLDCQRPPIHIYEELSTEDPAENDWEPPPSSWGPVLTGWLCHFCHTPIVPDMPCKRFPCSHSFHEVCIGGMSPKLLQRCNRCVYCSNLELSSVESALGVNRENDSLLAHGSDDYRSSFPWKARADHNFGRNYLAKVGDRLALHCRHCGDKWRSVSGKTGSVLKGFMPRITQPSRGMTTMRAKPKNNSIR